MKNENSEQSFYDKLASIYHLIFEDWDISMREQGKVLSHLIPPPDIASPILDCACGIGTQSLGLASLGYQVEGSDLSHSEIRRAQKEASVRGLSINFRVDDMRQLKTAPLSHYGVVMCMDNSLPHLDSSEDLFNSLTAMRDRLKNGGVLLISLRDYKKLLEDRPNVMPPKFFQNGKYRRFVHQIWDWVDERRYVVHLYITYETAEGWKSHHSVGHYRAVTVEEIVSFMEKVGFIDIRILEPAKTGYYQPIVSGRAP
ncbi:MAG: class I SAM-dependent methyltransferase [Parachlamydiaceae bacterium]